MNGSSIGSVPAAAPPTAVETAAMDSHSAFDTHSQQQWHMPAGIDLEHNPQAARRAAAKGIQSLPYMAEIYPIGGEICSTVSQRAQRDPTFSPIAASPFACPIDI